MANSFASLSSDCAREIYKYLDFKYIIRLWKTGDPYIRANLRLGLEKVEVNLERHLAENSWPGILPLFPNLRKVSLQGSEDSGASDVQIDLACLRSSRIEILKLTGLPSLFQRHGKSSPQSDSSVGETFKDIFPNLKGLWIGTDSWDWEASNYLLEDWSAFPTTLERLILDMDLISTVPTFGHYFPSLIQLHLDGIGPTSFPTDSDCFSLPPSLTALHLSEKLHCPTLLSLICGQATKSNLDHDATSINSHSSLSYPLPWLTNLTLYLGDIEGVQYWNANSRQSAKYFGQNLLNNLPPLLKSLKLILKHRPLPDGFADNLPRSLTRCKIKSEKTWTREELAAIPRVMHTLCLQTNNEWGAPPAVLKPSDSDALALDTSRSWLSKCFEALPPGLVRLQLDGLPYEHPNSHWQESELRALPRTLRVFEGHGRRAFSSDAQLDQLLPSLKQIFTHRLSSHNIASLPRTLTSLTATMPKLTEVALCAKRLQSLHSLKNLDILNPLHFECYADDEWIPFANRSTKTSSETSTPVFFCHDMSPTNLPAKKIVKTFRRVCRLDMVLPPNLRSITLASNVNDLSSDASSGPISLDFGPDPSHFSRLESIHYKVSAPTLDPQKLPSFIFENPLPINLRHLEVIGVKSSFTDIIPSLPAGIRFLELFQVNNVSNDNIEALSHLPLRTLVIYAATATYTQLGLAQLPQRLKSLIIPYSPNGESPLRPEECVAFLPPRLTGLQYSKITADDILNVGSPFWSQVIEARTTAKMQ